MFKRTIKMHYLEFSLTNTTPLTFKVWGITNDGGVKKLSLPPDLPKGTIVTMVSGKWPLGDYRDCDGRHTFVFEKADGVRFSLLLAGFTYDCSFPKEQQQAILDKGETYIGITLQELGAQDDDDEDDEDTEEENYVPL